MSLMISIRPAVVIFTRYEVVFIRLTFCGLFCCTFFHGNVPFVLAYVGFALRYAYLTP